MSNLQPPLQTSETSSEKSGLIQELRAKYQTIKEELRRRSVLENVNESALWWLQNATKTFDKKWKAKGLPSPYLPLPHDPYLNFVFAFLEADNDWLLGHGLPVDTPGKKHRGFTKSREVLLTWCVVGYCTWRCQLFPQTEVLFQSQNQEKANKLIEYSKYLWLNQEEWLREKFPLARRYKDLPEDEVMWANASHEIAIPEGAEKVRSLHPTILVMDEAAFQPAGETALDVALPVASEIIVLSSMNPGWFAEFSDAEDYEQQHSAA